MTRLGRAIVLTAFVACAWATPLGGRALERACAAGTVHVAVVVDVGNADTVSAVCVPAGSGDNGATVLAARASMLGVPQPRYSSSGLLCAIDGVPATGCGTAHDGHYDYWSYWHGSGGKWSYNNFGPASWRVTSGIVEGWRWQPNGAGLPTDPAPRGPATSTAICVPAPPPTTTPRTTATAPPSTPSATVGARQAPGTVASTGPASAVSSAVAAPVSATTAATGATVTTAGGRAPKRTAGELSSSSSSVALAARGIAAAGPTHASGGAPVGLLVGVPLVLGLGAGGAIAARRRRRPAS